MHMGRHYVHHKYSESISCTDLSFIHTSGGDLPDIHHSQILDNKKSQLRRKQKYIPATNHLLLLFVSYRTSVCGILRIHCGGNICKYWEQRIINSDGE